MTQERSNEKKASRNGQQSGPGLSLRTPAFCRPACRRYLWARGQRGSQILEYAIVVAAISAALTTMFVYGKRGMQGIIRATVIKEIGNQTDGLPAVGFMANSTSASRFDTLSDDSSHSSDQPGQRVVVENSFSASSGVATVFSVD